MDAMEALVGENAHIRELQAFHKALDDEKQFDVDLIRNIAYLSEEVGEVVHASRALNRAKGPSELEHARGQLGAELADCLAYILKLANYAEIDLQDAYLEKMQQNCDRNWRMNQDR